MQMDGYGVEMLPLMPVTSASLFRSASLPLCLSGSLPLSASRRPCSHVLSLSVSLLSLSLSLCLSLSAAHAGDKCHDLIRHALPIVTRAHGPRQGDVAFMHSNTRPGPPGAFKHHSRFPL